MQLSTKARYGLRALCHVAHRGYASAHVIAEQQAIPSRYLEEIIGELRKAGFVVGKRGPRGGYKLARPAADIAVSLRAGESIWTESSHRFRTDELRAWGAESGFACAGQWTDAEWPFAHTLLRAV